MRTTPTSETRPGGITALSLFCLAGAVISFIAGVSLLFPGSVLEPMWRVNPRGHAALAGIGVWASVLLFVVCAACALAGVGLWRGARWGYWLAIAFLTVNMFSDLANALLGTEPETIVGVPIVIAILAFLMSRRVRRYFSSADGNPK